MENLQVAEVIDYPPVVANFTLPAVSAPVVPAEFAADFSRFSKTGLTLTPGLPYEAWRNLGRFLKLAKQTVHFWIGDWIAYGQKEYGQKYKEALEETGLSYGTLRNVKYVASNVPLSLRCDKLKFGHFSVLARLDGTNQQIYADRAINEGLSVRALKALVTGKERKTCPTCKRMI